MSMPASAAQSMSRNAEPSMEEILASIRKIIADDQKALERKLETQTAVVAETEMAPDQPDNDDAGVTLMDESTAERDAALAAPVVAPVAAIEVHQPYVPHHDFRGAPAVEAPVAAVELPPIHIPAPVQPARPAYLPHGLMSHESTEAASASFQSLAHTVFSQNARTLDDLVKEMLKPMIASWLNENLPTLVERLVRAEIERVARGGR